MSCTLSAGQSWTLLLGSLPAAEVKSDGSRGAEYSYTVEEARLPGFEVTYENNEGISWGEIKITNKLLPGYVLPETGGSGVLPLVLAGLALISAAAFLLIRKRCRE